MRAAWPTSLRQKSLGKPSKVKNSEVPTGRLVEAAVAEHGRIGAGGTGAVA